MACLKEEFQSRIRINKFSIKKEFYLFGLWLEIFKDKNGIYIYINRKNLTKFIQEFANCQNKAALVAVVKTFIFVTDLNLFMNNICTILTMKKTKYYGKFI